jgi:hypothetical protein
MPEPREAFAELERNIRERPYLENKLPDLRVWDTARRLTIQVEVVRGQADK